MLCEPDDDLILAQVTKSAEEDPKEAASPKPNPLSEPVDPYSDAYLGGPHKRPLLRSEMLKRVVGDYDLAISRCDAVLDRRYVAFCHIGSSTDAVF